jgi:hypothetical protein
VCELSCGGCVLSNIKPSVLTPNSLIFETVDSWQKNITFTLLYCRFCTPLFVCLIFLASHPIFSLFLWIIKSAFQLLVALGMLYTHFLLFLCFSWFSFMFCSGGFFKREGKTKDHEVLLWSYSNFSNSIDNLSWSWTLTWIWTICNLYWQFASSLVYIFNLAYDKLYYNVHIF